MVLVDEHQWSRTQELPLQTFQGHEMTVSAIDVRAGDKLIMLMDGIKLLTFLSLIMVNADEVYLCSGSRDCTVRVWDISTGKVKMQNKISRNLVGTSLVHKMCC